MYNGLPVVPNSVPFPLCRLTRIAAAQAIDPPTKKPTMIPISKFFIPAPFFYAGIIWKIDPVNMLDVPFAAF